MLSVYLNIYDGVKPWLCLFTESQSVHSFSFFFTQALITPKFRNSVLGNKNK